MTMQTSISSMDFQGLDTLKIQAHHDADAALPEVAKQFEAVFIQAMVKSMRMGQLFLEESSPFKGKNEATFQEMLDAQYSTNIAAGKGIGFASLLTKQLQHPASDVQPVSFVQPAMPQKMAEVRKEEKGQETESSKSDTDDFIKSIWPYARQAASVLGLDPKILMAQAVLETGWGQYVAKDADGSSSNNVFNIKSGKNTTLDSVNVKTKEYIANTPITVQANFRKYPSVEHSFNDYVSLIKGSDRYQEALENVADPERFMQSLHKAGYATDPNYSSKIMSIYHSDELQHAMQRCGL